MFNFSSYQYFIFYFNKPYCESSHRKEQIGSCYSAHLWSVTVNAFHFYSHINVAQRTVVYIGFLACDSFNFWVGLFHIDTFTFLVHHPKDLFLMQVPEWKYQIFFPFFYPLVRYMDRLPSMVHLVSFSCKTHDGTRKIHLLRNFYFWICFII